MPTVAILNSHPVSVLKKEVSKTNIKGYSKMKKPELIVLMMKAENKPRFHHIKMREGKSAAAPKKKTKNKPVDGAGGLDTFDKAYKEKNTFLNDIMDSRSKKTDRKVGYKKVEAAYKKLLKEKPRPTGADVVSFYNKLFSEKEFYLE